MQENYFSKKDSMCLKGVAILFLLCFHLFDAERLVDYDIIFTPFKENMILDTVHCLKVCVSIFAFVTGYGLFKSVEKLEFTPKKVVGWTGKRLVKTMSGYWFIYIITIIVTLIIDQLPVSTYYGRTGQVFEVITNIVYDFFGVSTLCGSPSLMTTWWYMGAVITFIVAVPLIFKVSQKFGYFSVFVLLFLIPRLLNTGFPGSINPYTYMFALVFGMMFSKYNLFEKVVNFKLCKNKIASDIIMFVIYVAVIVITVNIYNNISRDDFWEFRYCVIVIPFICFFKKYITGIKGINNIFAFLGKHSLNIFLIHSFVRVYLEKFIYSLKYPILMLLVLLGISLAMSIVVNLLKKLVHYDNFVNKTLVPIFDFDKKSF